jgi:multicomponent Na+:H+ antiporter subunit D
LNLLAILPFLIPLTGAAISLLLRRDIRAQAAWSFGAMISAFVCSAALLWTVYSTGQPLVFQMGAWPAPFGISITADVLSATMAVMVQLIFVFGFLYAIGCKDRCAQYPGFYPLFLTLAAGLTGAMLTGDIFNLFVMVELVVISGTVLTAIADDRFGVEAAYKYFYISTLASISLLLAIGCLYVSYGTLNMAQLAELTATRPNEPLLYIAMVFLAITFMVKSAVPPFHFWQPDIYTAAPTPISAILSAVVSKIGVYGFLRMTTLLFVEQAAWLQGVLIVLGVAGVIFGGLGALGTHNAKRMLAYSSLAQIGFILVGIGWGTPLALAAAVIFTFNHSLIKSAMLMLAGYLASRAPIKTASFSVIHGTGKYAPLAGVLFFLGALALAGIPPMNGFVSKLTLFESGVSASASQSVADAVRQWLPLALIGVSSILTLVYTLRAFQRIWWEPFEPESPESKVKSTGDRLLAPGTLIALCLVLGIWAEPLIQLAQTNASWMGSPTNYIRAVHPERTANLVR